MGLSRLDNFLKSVRGTILYVDPNSLDSTDSIENQGNSLTRPFKTIQRALLEVSRFSYQGGLNNDRFNKTTILLYPGDHIVDNRPGYIPTDTAGQYFKRSGQVVQDFSPFNLTTNFDLTVENNSLYKLNSIYGGVIIPRGTSIVGMDLRKTKIRPTYVPNPENSQIERSCVFRVTGACYLWQFTILDANPNEICYKDYTSNQFVPNFSHHKLAGFEYADGVNDVSIADDFITFLPDGRTDLDMYYQKVGIAYGQGSGRAIEPDFPYSVIDIQPVIDEYRIVGSRGTEIGISSIKSGNGVTGTKIITVDFSEATDQFNVDTPIQINGVGASGYDGTYVVGSVLNSTQIQYQVQNIPLNPLPGVTGAKINIEVDTVTSASPYIFNVSLRSVYGMCGLLADGNKAAGFKSMVVAQYTGIGLQKDDNAFVKYDIGSGTYLDSASVSNIHSDSRARFKPSYENFHIKATNNAYLQLVSVFAIGFAEHFSVESGGDFSVNNSNSNFGAKALSASGFRPEAFPRDDIGYFTHIISPKEIENEEIVVDYLSLDVSTIVSAATTSRLYLYNETNLNNPPEEIVDGYRIGAKNNDRLCLQISENNATTEYSARIVIPNNGIVLNQNSSEKTFTVGRSVAGINSISGNILSLTSSHSFLNGESIRIISETGNLPDGVDNNQVYYAITSGIGSDKIKIAQTLNDAINNNAFTLNSTGGVLSIVSRVSDKNSGDVGHPIQYDIAQSNWYVNVATDNTICPKILSLGTAGLGNATTRTYIKRNPITRNLADSVYRIRYVIPKDSPTTARPPLEGYVIQESNNTIGTGTTEIAKYFSQTTATLTNSNQLRNPRFIANANWSGGTANIITELPHDLTVGAQVEVLNISSTNNTTGIKNYGYNGTFSVAGISSSKQFSYNLANDPGIFTNDISARTSTLPRFNRKKLSGTYYIYRSEEIKKYIPNIQDGIYHLVVVNSSNSPTIAPFAGLRFSQPIQNLYPQINRDNATSDPKAAKSFALPDLIGQVVVDEPQNSITKETVEQSLVDFNVGIGITNILSSSQTNHTLYTTIDHSLCPATSLSILNGGSGYVTGTYYNVRLTGSANGVNATARVTVSSGAVTDVLIMDGGSAYVVGNTASLVGVGTVGSGAIVTIQSIYDNVGDCLSLSGVSSASYSGYNTLYKISGISTAKQITVQSSEAISLFNTIGLGVTVTQNAHVLLTGKTLGISTFTYNSTTNVGIVTFTSAHGLLVNNKVRLTGFNNSSYNGDYLIKKINSLTSINVNVGLATTALSVGAGSSAYIPALTSYGGDIDINTENTSGRLISEYGGIRTTLGAIITASALETSPITILNANILGLNIGDYIQIDNEIFRINTTVTSNSILAFRGLFGTPRQPHNIGSIVKRIKILPVELRRNSIIRASAHTFEYLGFGPGNYSTAFPERQDRSLSEKEILLAQSTNSDGGVSVYSAMDDRGDFFTANKKINSKTGQEEIYNTPIPTITGEDPTIGGDIGFNVLSPLQISVHRSIKVEGGADSNLISEFEGPVVFNNKITSTSIKGFESKSLFVRGDQSIPRKYTVGISTPSLAGNPGDVLYKAFPDSGGYIGWVYTSNNLWEKFGRIGNPSLENNIGVSTNSSYVGVATLINFRTQGITLASQYNANSGITTLLFTGTGPQVTTIGISTSKNNTFCGVGTQVNFIGENIVINAFTDQSSGLTTVSLVGIGTTNIYSALKYIKTDGQSTGGIPNILRVDGTESKLKIDDVLNALGYLPAQSSQVSGYPVGNSIVLDTISGAGGTSFNGNQTDFTMKYVGVAYTPFGSAANLIVSLGGVIQKPGFDFSIVQGPAVIGGTLNTSTIRFTTAPAAGLSDFIVSLGGQGILLEDPAWDAKGDLLVGTGNNAATKLSTGTNNQILTVDTTTNTGLKWATVDNSTINDNLRLGGSISQNYIAFVGTFNDNNPQYTHTFIGERLYQANEKSELFLFKGNDVSDASGPDRIRLASGEIRFDTYNSITSGTFEEVATSASVTNKMILTGDGRLGIGIVTPTQSLHVQGNVRITGGLYDSNNAVGAAGSVLISNGTGLSWTRPGLSISTSTSSTPQFITFVSGASTTSIGITASNLTFIPSTGVLSSNEFLGKFLGKASNTVTTPSFAWDEDITSGFYRASSGNIGITISGIEKLRINTTGVGIGTENPTQSLHVQGNVRITGGLYDVNNVVGAAGSVLISNGTGLSWSSGALTISTSTSSTPQFITFVSGASTTSIGIQTSNLTFIPSTSRLGIGTTNPLQRLHVVDAIVVSAANTTTFNNAIQTKAYATQYSIEDVDAFGTRQYISISKSDTSLFRVNDDSFNTRFIVTSAGDVGIGTTNPKGQLQVSSGPVIVGSATSTGTASQTLQVTGGAYVSGSVGVGTTNPIGRFQVGSASTSGVVVITNSGFVGLGTTNPLQRLHVVDSILVSAASTTTLTNAIQTKAYPNQFSVSEDVDGFGTRQYISIDKSDTALLRVNDDSFNTKFIVTGIGSVGIGTTTPIGQLQVGSQSSIVIVDNMGDLGIGTANPTSKLWVEGDGRFTGVVTATTFAVTSLNISGVCTFISGPLLIGAGVGASTGTPSQPLQVTGGAYVSGNLGIGAINPTSKLTVTGDILSSSLAGVGNRALYSDANGIITNSSSDERLKENVLILTYGLDAVSKMNPVSFDWIDKERRGEQKEIGLIAQEIEKLVPEVVGVNSDETLSVDYAKLVPVLIKAIQELSEKVEKLENK